MQRPSLAHFSRQLSLRYVDLLLPRARRSGRYQSNRYTVSTGSFEKKKYTSIAATVVAHVFAAAFAAHKASPSWLLPSYVYVAGSSAHRHPHLVATKSNYHAAGSSAH